MDTYPYDPTTGERLMRAGLPVNPIQPMTQEEVDRQHEAVNTYLEEDPVEEIPLAKFTLTLSYLVDKHRWEKFETIKLKTDALSDPYMLRETKRMSANYRRTMLRAQILEDKPVMVRMWINQPSEHQKEHALHGMRVLAPEKPYQRQYVDVYPVDDERESVRVFAGALEEGWPEKSNA